MSLPKPTFLVEVLDTPDDTEGTVHTVTVLYGDQLRAELEAGRNMVDMSQSFHLTGLWVWAALARTGVTEKKWQEFKPLIAAIDKPKPTAAGEESGGDPTPAGVPTPSP